MPAIKARDARRLRAPELPVLDVDVVDDLGDRRRGPARASANRSTQHLEGAAVAVVGEGRLEHVERELPVPGPVALPGDELERRLPDR